jgi:EAL domain-containing protein (putative c-di-GMP-specific phosphodiesterase class I)
MFKEIRSLFQMLDQLDAEEAVAAPAVRAAPAAVELPQSLGSAAAGPPRILIFDTDAPSARSLAAILGGSGVEADLHHKAAGFAAACAAVPPPLVFIDVDGQGDTAIDLLVTMSEHHYPGTVQLMGAGSLPVIEVVRRMGARHALRMLPVLKKPLDMLAVQQVLKDQNLYHATASGGAPSLKEALAQEWIEFRYQPKIDLRRMQIAGVETFARVLHPQLARRALASALRAATRFSNLGINLRLAVNVPVQALFQLPIADLVREYGPDHQRWPGLLLDVTEEQVMAELPRVQAVSAALTACNVRLAIDDFGRGMLPPGKLRELPFLELKLDRNFVNGCATDAGRADTCRSVIDLAHSLDCVAVAVGVENTADMRALAAMGCGLGQGYLFGQPMPEEELVGAMLERAVKRKQSPQRKIAGTRRTRLG